MAASVDARDLVQSRLLQPQYNLRRDTDTNPTASSPIANTTTAASERRYLSLKPLKKLDLPHHPAYDSAASDHLVSLVQFLDNLFNEIRGIELDEGFEDRGTWSPENGHVMMPPLNATENDDANSVPVSVERRVKDLNQAKWAVRTSTHSDTHIRFSELGDLLAKDHSRNEAIYTPSVFDAVELLKWDREELLEALQESGHQEEIHSVEMFISQMFHMMPKVACFNLLQDRVFHVLIVTANTYRTESPTELSRSFTVQLPIDYASFGDVKIVQERSRVQTKGSSHCYQVPSNAECGWTPDANLKQRQGRKLVEGTYVSLERLIGASQRTSIDGDVMQQEKSAHSDRHRWDMMTLSTAGGMTRKAPRGIQQKETLEAIAMDVEYVLKHIAGQRQKNRT